MPAGITGTAGSRNPMFCRIELAGPPRGKGRGRAFVGKSGHASVYTDAKTRSYEAQIRFAAQQAMQGRPPTGLPVRLLMSVFFAIPVSWSKRQRERALCGATWPTVKPDADNSLKLSDALNGIVFDDDKQVVIATVFKSYAEKPGLLIEVEEIHPPAVIGRSLMGGVAELPLEPSAEADIA